MSRLKDIYIEEMERIAADHIAHGAPEHEAYDRAADEAHEALYERIRTSPEFTRQ